MLSLPSLPVFFPIHFFPLPSTLTIGCTFFLPVFSISSRKFLIPPPGSDLPFRTAFLSLALKGLKGIFLPLLSWVARWRTNFCSLSYAPPPSLLPSLPDTLLFPDATGGSRAFFPAGLRSLVFLTTPFPPRFDSNFFIFISSLPFLFFPMKIDGRTPLSSSPRQTLFPISFHFIFHFHLP